MKSTTTKANCCGSARSIFVQPHAEAAEVRNAHPQASLIAFRRGERKPVVFALEQQLRSDAKAVIDSLKARGLELMILSGDQRRAVIDIADALGIERYHAGISPTDKIALIEAEKAKGKRVMMVGDGLNDAPALASADVSPVAGHRSPCQSGRRRRIVPWRKACPRASGSRYQ